ncbi:acetyl-CoA hydrolase/transferase C-terminal domain-containing protein [Mycobacterium genavense]|uniref:acetyl-CoA hydrolase/transferase C-terminal domain-containing protein n=1 Tax=Mycobacterium genavense TaxID=36812 RepID=UPI00046EE9F4|nr:acetyl-CoA hydrolase/transferase C-terminal domain-containing protein [Mycobacterium genavense]
MAAGDFEDALRSLTHPGATIALGDGVGRPGTATDVGHIGSALSRIARAIGGIRLVVGWLPAPVEGIEPDAFREIVALMPGWGARTLTSCPNGTFVPTRLSATPALLSGRLMPDVLITRLVRRSDGLHFGTEVSWQRRLVESGVPVLAIIDDTAPSADAGPPLKPELVSVVGYSEDGPALIAPTQPDAIHQAIADAVIRFIPEGARLQVGPGQGGTAVLNRVTTAVNIDTGLLTDAVVDLDRRGLLIGTPSATYLLGSKALYDWADGKPILRGIEYTHDLTRLSRGAPLIAVNTAIEIDPWGQVNVEGIDTKVVGGIGGHPDYCAAGAISADGISIIAVLSTPQAGLARRSALVTQLSRPASTPTFDIDLIVTESGHVDLRGANWEQRRELIVELFSGRNS